MRTPREGAGAPSALHQRLREAIQAATAELRAADPVLALTTVRWSGLFFSVPYLWVWTRALSWPMRTAATIAHACALLAACAWNDAADADRDLPPHLGLIDDPARVSPVLARHVASVFAALAVVASLPLVALHPFAPLAVGAVLAAAWFVAYLQPETKYLGFPEVALPATVLTLPAVGLLASTEAQPPGLTIVAGTGYLLATLLACHLRDAQRDAAAGIVTVAHRFGPSTARWMWLAGLVGGVAGTATVYRPIDTGELLSLAGAAGFLVGLAVRRYRVPLIVASHGVFAISLLLR